MGNDPDSGHGMKNLSSDCAQAEGFANIALIKYMGKDDAERNVPSNPSLSYTLRHLKTTVAVSGAPDGVDRWDYLSGPGNVPLHLTLEGEGRFLRYARKLCDLWDHPRGVLVRSASNFPADAGIASSASSFSAATKAVASFLHRPETATQLAHLSQTGSGSSCRSFFEPWCIWDGDSIEAIEFPGGSLLHMVVVVDGERKSVSSSDAHRRVPTSPHFAGRANRARSRLDQLVRALADLDWRSAYDISLAEFLDMHELFHTSDPPFQYRTAESERIVAEGADLWSTHRDGPIVTMDAGPNVHFLFRRDQKAMCSEMHERLAHSHRVLSSEAL
jgi:diphosphomevalonate decarboxylase